MIEILQETTDWGDAPVANGIYHVNVQGHLVQHNDKVFKNPIKQFSKARRTFEKIGERVDPQTRSDVKIVMGSKGQQYFIEDGKCSANGLLSENDQSKGDNIIQQAQSQKGLPGFSPAWPLMATEERDAPEHKCS